MLATASALASKLTYSLTIPITQKAGKTSAPGAAAAAAPAPAAADGARAGKSGSGARGEKRQVRQGGQRRLPNIDGQSAVGKSLIGMGVG